MKLRPLTDAGGLTGLYCGTHGPSLAFLMTLEKQASCCAWVLEDASRVKGAIWFTRVDGEAELVDIRVEASSRQQGLGARMLRESLAVLATAGVTTCHLEVRESNDIAQRLYRRLGFAESGCRHHYYGAGDHREHAILMTLKLEAMSSP